MLDLTNAAVERLGEQAFIVVESRGIKRVAGWN